MAISIYTITTLNISGLILQSKEGIAELIQKQDPYRYSLEESESEVAQPCPTFCDPMDCSLPGSSVHGIFQARVLEWVAISFSRGSSQPRDRIWDSHIAGRCFIVLCQAEGTDYKKFTSDLKTRIDWKWRDGKDNSMQMEIKTEVAIIISHNIDFKTRTIITDKEEYYTVIKESTNPTGSCKYIGTPHRSTKI